MSNCSQVMKPLPIWIIVQYSKNPWLWCSMSHTVLDNRDVFFSKTQDDMQIRELGNSNTSYLHYCWSVVIHHHFC